MLEPLFRNWPLKLLSLALAFAIWLAVVGQDSIVQDFRVPVDLELPAGLIPGEAPPTTVSVRLRGPERIFRRTDPLPLELTVNLRDAAPGTRNVQLGRDSVRGVPAGLDVELIEPDRFRVLLERRARKSLPVVPSFSGQPPQGYSVYQVRVVPDSVEVEGPDSRVGALTRLRTDPIHLEGRVSPFSERVSAVPNNPEVRVLDPRPLEVAVEIDQSPITTSFPAVPVVLAGKVYEGFAVPSSVSVTLSGPPALLRSIRPSQLRAVADVSGLAPSAESHHLPLRVEFLDMSANDLGRISVKSLSRSKVAVNLTRRRVSG